MVVSHTKSEVTEDPVIGDKVILADIEYHIIDIGEDAVKNLRTNGHVTFIFNDKMTAEMSGQIILGGNKSPRVMVGDTIEIF